MSSFAPGPARRFILGILAFRSDAPIKADIGWFTDAQTRRTDRTLDYVNRTTERDFIDHLWDLQDFTICFEKHKGAHISYRRYSDVTAAPNRARSIELARDWWKLVENESATMEDCGKPFDVERRLMVVYGRLEALASCAAAGVCDFEAFRKMIEAFDYMTVLSISNYILLAGTEERKSRASGRIRDRLKSSWSELKIMCSIKQNRR